MIKDRMMEEIKDFQLPSYKEIPNVGLFLEQVAKYISEFLAPLDEVVLTPSMISNYVKKDIISNPVKKQYDREQIAYLFFIAVAKNVLSLDDIRLLIDLQKDSYDTETAYEYFRSQFREILFAVFGMEQAEKGSFSSGTDERSLLKNTATTMAHKVYLDKYFKLLKEQNAEENTEKD